MKLKKHEHIITSYASRASGPGWSNTPVWVVIRDSNTNKIREGCLQPEEQTKEMRLLYSIAERVHVVMMNEANKALTGKKKN